MSARLALWPSVLIAAIFLALVSSGLSAALNDDWVSALEKRDLSKIEKLIELGVDVNLSTDRGKTALMLAAQEGSIHLVRGLLKAGADMNHTTQSGGTALMYSVLSGDLRPVEVLLSDGAAVNARAKFGWTAIMIAAVKGYTDTVKLLIAHGADVNTPDIYGWTPLMRATFENRPAVVETLLQVNDIDLDAGDEYGATALHHAAIKAHLQIVRLLLAHGANLQLKDTKGRTPLMAATQQGQTAVVELLKQAIARKASP